MTTTKHKFIYTQVLWLVCSDMNFWYGKIICYDTTRNPEGYYGFRWHHKQLSLWDACRQQPETWKTTSLSLYELLLLRQWQKVYDLFHTFFARCASQRTTGHARIARETSCSCYSCNVQKRVTKSDTQGHCLLLLALEMTRPVKP